MSNTLMYSAVILVKFIIDKYLLQIASAATRKLKVMLLKVNHF